MVENTRAQLALSQLTLNKGIGIGVDTQIYSLDLALGEGGN